MPANKMLEFECFSGRYYTTRPKGRHAFKPAERGINGAIGLKVCQTVSARLIIVLPQAA